MGIPRFRDLGWPITLAMADDNGVGNQAVVKGKEMKNVETGEW